MKRCYIHLIGSDVLALMKYYILYISGLKGNIHLESFGGVFFFITLATQTAAGKQCVGELPVATSRHRGFRCASGSTAFHLLVLPS